MKLKITRLQKRNADEAKTSRLKATDDKSTRWLARRDNAVYLSQMT